MPAVKIEYIFYGIYLLLGPISWGLLGWMMVLGRRRMKLIKWPHDPVPLPPPAVTILIPAKDEGERIGDCIQSALDQDYPNFKVIAIDDRSTDRTGTVMDEMAAGNPKLRIVHIQHGALPPGWTGKCNALHTAVKDADGEWLLFVDSDVVLQPAALSATLGMAERKHFDLVSLMPRLESHSFWEELIVPLAGAALGSLYAVALTNNGLLRNTAFANGQFMLFRRKAYDAVGGHEAVRDKFCEDIEIARMMKMRGLRPRVSWGEKLAAVRMYSSLPQIMRGWARIFFAGDTGKAWRIWIGIFFLIFCGFSVYPALAWGSYRWLNPSSDINGIGWLAAVILHLSAMTILIGVMYAWTGNARRNALLFPIGGALLLGIFFRALWMCTTGKVTWRGTSYSPSPAREKSINHG